MERMTTSRGRCPYPAPHNFLWGKKFELRYAQRRKILGWSIRNRLVDQYENRPISFEYICPFCGCAIEGRMYEGWKHCICPNCGRDSDFSITLNSPYGYFYGGGICDGKEPFDDGYFAWVSNLPVDQPAQYCRNPEDIASVLQPNKCSQP